MVLAPLLRSSPEIMVSGRIVATAGTTSLDPTPSRSGLSEPGLPTPGLPTLRPLPPPTLAPLRYPILWIPARQFLTLHSKTYNGAIGVDEDGNPCGTVLEAAKAAGYHTGLVVTSRITVSFFFLKCLCLLNLCPACNPCVICLPCV